MPRHSYKKLLVKPDNLYNSIEIAKLINYLTRNGEKAVAKGIVYQVMEMLKKNDPDPLKTLNMALSNVFPLHEVKPKRLGGASYLVPIEVRTNRKLFLGLNWDTFIL